LLAGGADLQVVKERLGHAKMATTAGYLHTLPSADETALAALGKIRGSGVADGDAGLIVAKREIRGAQGGPRHRDTADPVNGGGSRTSRTIGHRGERPALTFSRTKYPVQWTMATSGRRGGSAGSWEG
jgi:hypothetical protein